jgi:hypothetical protein
MNLDFFVEAAHHSVEQSIELIHNNKYGKACEEDFIARAAYLGDTIVQCLWVNVDIVTTAYSGVVTALTLRMFTPMPFTHSVKALFETVNRIIRGATGGLYSPLLAYHWKDTNLLGRTIWSIGQPEARFYEDYPAFVEGSKRYWKDVPEPFR